MLAQKNSLTSLFIFSLYPSDKQHYKIQNKTFFKKNLQ